MRATPSVLDLTTAVSNPSKLDVMKEHHYWCPWVSTLPSYQINKGYRNTPTKLAHQVRISGSLVSVECAVNMYFLENVQVFL